jgi:hypothetical protein
MEETAKKKRGRPKGSLNTTGPKPIKRIPKKQTGEVTTTEIGDLLIVDLCGKSFKKIIFSGSPNKITTEQV